MAGWPVTRLSAAGVIHCTSTHGCGPVGRVNVQPATTNWSVSSATGIPLASTRALEVIVVICPPWGQLATAPTWNRGPAMVTACPCRVRGSARPGSRDHQRGLVDGHCRPDQRDHGALAVGDVDARIADADEGTGRALQHDAARG